MNEEGYAALVSLSLPQMIVAHTLKPQSLHSASFLLPDRTSKRTKEARSRATMASSSSLTRLLPSALLSPSSLSSLPMLSPSLRLRALSPAGLRCQATKLTPSEKEPSPLPSLSPTLDVASSSPMDPLTEELLRIKQIQETTDFWEGPQWDKFGFVMQYLWVFGIVVSLIGCGIAVKTYNLGASDFKETPVYKEAMESQGLFEDATDSQVFEDSAPAPPVQETAD